MKHLVQKNLVSRLKRIEGQVRGLQRLVEEHTYCIDVITQTQAVKSALGAFESAMLKNHLETHVVEQMRDGKEKKAIEEILKIHRLGSKK